MIEVRDTLKYAETYIAYGFSWLSCFKTQEKKKQLDITMIQNHNKLKGGGATLRGPLEDSQ
jgi:hypothetical protein